MSPSRPQEVPRRLIRPQSNNGSDESGTSSRGASCDFPSLPVEPTHQPTLNTNIEMDYRKWSEGEGYKPVVMLADASMPEGMVLANGLKLSHSELWGCAVNGSECPHLLQTLYSVYSDRYRLSISLIID